ncbi:MAG: PAS domain S-box protein, partial [Armatimonadetes bacterium]|nr:PAS domain S-box protein [Armatimonadota bacterium]
MYPARVVLLASKTPGGSLERELASLFPQAEVVRACSAGETPKLQPGDLVVCTEDTLIEAASLARPTGAVLAAVLPCQLSQDTPPVDVWVRLTDGWPEELRRRVLAAASTGASTAGAGTTSPAVFFVDRLGRILRPNLSARSLADAVAGGVRVSSVWELVPAAQHAQIRELLRRLFDDADSVSGELFLIPNSSGSYHPIVVSAYPWPRGRSRPRLAVCRCQGDPLLNSALSLPGTPPEVFCLDEVRRASQQDFRQAARRVCEVARQILCADGAVVVVLAAPETKPVVLASSGCWQASQALREAIGEDFTPEEADNSAGDSRPSVLHSSSWRWLVASSQDADRSVFLFAASNRAEPWPEGTERLFRLWGGQVLQALLLGWAARDLQVRVSLMSYVLGASSALGEMAAAVGKGLAQLPDLIESWVAASCWGTGVLDVFGAGKGERAEVAAEVEAVARQALSAAGPVLAAPDPQKSGAALTEGGAFLACACDVPRRRERVAIVARFATTAAAAFAVPTVSFAAQLVAEALSITSPAEGLAVSESHYRAVFEASAAGAMVVDSRGWIRLVNKRFEQLTGYRRREVVGRMKAVLLAAPEEWSRVEALRRRRLAGDRGVLPSYEVD